MVYFAFSLDQKTSLALFPADGEQLDAVRRMFPANDVENVNQPGQGTRRVLPIARGGADGIDYLRFSVSSCAHRFGNFQKGFQLERRLRDYQRRMQRWKLRDFAGVANHE